MIPHAACELHSRPDSPPLSRKSGHTTRETPLPGPCPRQRTATADAYEVLLQAGIVRVCRTRGVRGVIDAPALAERSEIPSFPVFPFTMKLTEKDKQFMERLKELVDEGVLWIEHVSLSPGYFVLRGNYGSRIAREFGMTRQGVRWRFWRLFCEIYVSAYTTILFMERTFGSQLREGAMSIARERHRLRQEMLKEPLFKEGNAYRKQNQD